MNDPFVVIGGDAAGLSAASKCKRDDPDREVIVYERGEWISYAMCGMPYYVKGEVEALSDLLSLRPDDVADRGIELRRHHEITAIDPDEKRVRGTGPDGDFEQAYGKALIATGATARTAAVDGTSLDNVFTMHDMNQACRLRALLTPPDAMDPGAFVDEHVDVDYLDVRTDVEEYLAREPPETVAIVGGGYVGVEMAEAFAAWDLDVHLYHRPPRPAPPFGEAVGDEIAEYLEDGGLTLHLDTTVYSLEGNGEIERVEASDGTQEVDLALVGVGLRPNVDFVAGTGIERGNSGAIATDEYGHTSAADVFAAGDCAEKRHAVTGELEWVPLGLTANRSGRAIGTTVAGTPTPIGDIVGTAALKVFDLECGRSGILDSTAAQTAGFDPVSKTVTAGSRSGYYPGGDETTVTLVADRDSGRLLGGAIAGEDRGAIRIDTVATALHNRMTISELERLDLAYAPPFSPVWDPVLVGAKVLAGDLRE